MAVPPPGGTGTLAHIKAILEDVAPALLAVHGVGYETVGQLLVTSGDNPDRLDHEKSFAALCGSSLIQASTAVDRHANWALWAIVLVLRRFGGSAVRRAT